MAKLLVILLKALWIFVLVFMLSAMVGFSLIVLFDKAAITCTCKESK